MGLKRENNTMKWMDDLHKAIKSAKGRIAGLDKSLDKTFDAVSNILTAVRGSQRTVWWIGNGGSAAICSHLSQDMMNKLGIRSIYHGDTSLLTCMANDFGYEQVYARPLKQLAAQGDVLIAISSSGNSENILSCVETARQKDMKIITLSGMNEDNRLWNYQSDVSFLVLYHLYGIVELSHEALLHGVIETLWLQSRPSSKID